MPKVDYLTSVMPWRKPVLYFVVMTTLTSLLKLGNGQEAGAVLQLTPQETNSDASMRSGMLRIRSNLHSGNVMHDGKNEPVATTGDGSLADTKIPTTEHTVMDAKLKHLNPSVRCSNNSMTLKVKRMRAPFLVDSGEGPPVPLSHIPSSCGFSVRRSRRDVHFVAPYQGCHVTQQDGNYVLPLRFRGTPMTMSCPVAPPPPSVCCFPSGMVVKIGGIIASGLKVKVSGMWESLSSVCDSCGFALEEHSGGLILTAPYHKGLCIEMKSDEYLLSLLLADGELLVTCPSRKDVQKPTTPSQGGPSLQYPQFPVFPQDWVFPGPVPQTQRPAPVTNPVVQMPQRPMFQRPMHPPSITTSPTTDRQDIAPAQHPEISFMSQYPWLSHYPMFPRPVPSMQSPSVNKNSSAPPGQLPQMPPSQQWLMAQGALHAMPPHATTAQAFFNRPVPTVEDVMPQLHQQPQFPGLPQHAFPLSPNLPLHPESGPHGSATAVDTLKPGIHGHQQHANPQTYQMPVVYPPPKYPIQKGNVHSLKPQTAPPATSQTTTASTAVWPPLQRPFYHPNLYMPSYYPQQAHNAPAKSTIPNSSGQSGPQNHHPIHSFDRFRHQWQDSLAGGTHGNVDNPQQHQQVPFMPFDALQRYGYGSWGMPYASYLSPSREASHPYHEKK
ncbi:uncharacterized protein LOC115358705 [Myripristis murdjan]|uniref:Uncharacterized LOC115358705 n=1 Tax=Myripristis murdjan TaxID=586833 RepID=A0A667YRG4_9TELE|nr:uncharacterized protein LOC115358705 [Myripristis murdjan]